MSSATPGGRCGLCSKPGRYRCGGCKAVQYCSLECQRTHWTKGHKGQCQVLRSHETTQHLLPASATVSASVPSPTPKPTQIQTQTQTPKKATPIPSQNPTAKTTATTKGGGGGGGDFLFPASKFQELMSFKPDIFPGSGIRNVGNTCYLNSVLQCFIYTAPLQSYLLTREHSASCKFRVKKEFCSLCSFEEIVFSLLSRDQNNDYFPRTLLENLGKIFMDFAGFGRQEDAHEFALGLLNTMQSEIVKNVDRKLTMTQEETTLLGQLFFGSLSSSVACMRCGHLSISKEPISAGLQLPIETGMQSVEEMLHRFASVEALDLDVGYRCGKCSQTVLAQKQVGFCSLPNILLLQLKRFDILTGGGKINKTILFRNELDVARYINPHAASSTGQGQSTIYDLYAVIVHYGPTMFSGHYVAFVRIHNMWYLFDDHNVCAVEDSIVFKQNAYILWYQKRVSSSSLSSSSDTTIDSGVNGGGKKKKNKRKKKGGNGGGQQQQASDPSGTGVVAAAEALTNVNFTKAQRPKHIAFYREEEGGVMKDIVLKVDLPVLPSAELCSLKVSDKGVVELSCQKLYKLKLDFGVFDLVPGTATAIFHIPDKVLIAYLPIRHDGGDSGSSSRPNLVEVKVESVQTRNQVKVDRDRELTTIADEEDEIEGEAKSTLSSSVSSAYDPLAQIRKMMAPMKLDAGNQEEQTYNQLYADITTSYEFGFRPNDLLRSAQTERTRQQYLEQQQQLLEAQALAQKKVGRNDDCPCGSGKKFKKCHG